MSESASASAGKYADYSREQFLAEINRLKKTKKYGLVWEHKTEQVIEDFKNGKQPYLKEVTDKRIENAPNEPTNLIIEGDNFDALSILSYTHAGKVDVIYIDPPYNTGNKDFIYNDNYVDSEDEFRHSKWLSFMEPRLRLANRLLSNRGTIFISIDDIENSNLKLLCDSIFGIDNYVTTIPRLTKAQRSGQEKYMDISHDYLLVYSYSEDFAHISEREYDEASVLEDKNGRYLKGDTKAILAAISQGYSKGGDYDFEYNGKVYKPVTASGVRNRWLWRRERMEAAAKLGILVEAGNTLRMQLYLDKKFDQNSNTLVPKNDRLIFHTSDFMYKQYANSIGFNEFKKVMEGNMSYGINPKPTALMKQVISFCDDKNITVLDFFAGTGSTGQAVLELNREDGGHRQFILCTNNGDKGPDSVKIAEDITYPRMKTVITGKRQDNSKYSDGIPANLRYYKIEHKEKKASIDANRLEIVRYLEDIIQVKENAFEQIEMNEDLALYKNSERFVGMVFEPFALEEIIESIKEKNSENKPVKLYVFSYSRDAFEDNYGTDFEIEFVAMPEGLLKTYANIVAEIKKEDA